MFRITFKITFVSLLTAFVSSTVMASGPTVITDARALQTHCSNSSRRCVVLNFKYSSGSGELEAYSMGSQLDLKISTQLDAIKEILRADKMKTGNKLIFSLREVASPGQLWETFNMKRFTVEDFLNLLQEELALREKRKVETGSNSVSSEEILY